MKKNISVADLKKGQIAEIYKIKKDDLTAQRLRDIGFREGAAVKCVCSGIFGDPSAYLVMGAVIALRRCDAKAILCVRSGEAS